MRTILTIFVLSLAVQARAVLMDSQVYYVLIGTKEFKTQVTREQVAKTPAWAASADFPPLSARKAERLAVAKFHKLLPDKSDWERKRIVIESIGDDAHWYYRVEFAPVEPQLGRQGSLEIVVLMDGKVIEPEVSDAK
jgi:hypothetical protein